MEEALVPLVGTRPQEGKPAPAWAISRKNKDRVARWTMGLLAGFVVLLVPLIAGALYLRAQPILQIGIRSRGCLDSIPLSRVRYGSRASV
jgi:hypothetical protein